MEAGAGRSRQPPTRRTGHDGPPRLAWPRPDAFGRWPGSSSASAGRTAKRAGRRGWPRCAPSSPASGRVRITAIRQPDRQKTRFYKQRANTVERNTGGGKGDPLAADFFAANTCHRQGLRSATVAESKHRRGGIWDRVCREIKQPMHNIATPLLRSRTACPRSRQQRT